MDALLQAIMNKIAGSALSADVGGRVFLDEAPEGAEFPYVVFFIVSGSPDDAFAKPGEEILIQFSLFSDSTSAVEIADMYADLEALFRDGTLTVTGSTTVNVEWQALATMTDEVTTPAGSARVKHWAVDYRITLQDS